MLKVSTTTKFDSETEIARKRGKEMSKLGDIIKKLSEKKTFRAKTPQP